MWDLNDYVKTWLRSHRSASNMQIRTASQKSTVEMAQAANSPVFGPSATVLK